MDKKEIFKPFAIAGLFLSKIVKDLEEQYKDSLDDQTKNILKKQISGIKHLIDRSIRVTGDFIPVHASAEAVKYCGQKSLGDIFNIKWSEQAGFEKKKNRTSCKLKHEHKTPVKSLVDAIKRSVSEDEALEVFLKQEIVWILKEEDKKLPKTVRPDSNEAYRKAGIKIIKNKNEYGHLFAGNKKRKKHI